MNIINHLKNNVEKYSVKVGFIDDKKSMTYQEMYEQVEKFSNSSLFSNEEKVVSLISENSLTFVIAYLGIINSGKIVHLISPNITEKNFVDQYIKIINAAAEGDK